jgi:hypothetical protein
MKDYLYLYFFDGGKKLSNKKSLNVISKAHIHLKKFSNKKFFIFIQVSPIIISKYGYPMPVPNLLLCVALANILTTLKSIGTVVFYDKWDHEYPSYFAALAFLILRPSLLPA